MCGVLNRRREEDQWHSINHEKRRRRKARTSFFFNNQTTITNSNPLNRHLQKEPFSAGYNNNSSLNEISTLGGFITNNKKKKPSSAVEREWNLKKAFFFARIAVKVKKIDKDFTLTIENLSSFSYFQHEVKINKTGVSHVTSVFFNEYIKM